MRRWTTIATLATLLATSVSAQNTGEGAVQAASAAKSSEWKNWAIAGGAVVAAAIGITLVLLSPGSPRERIE